MKKILSVLLTITLIISVLPLSVFSIPASAETATSGTTGDCTWSLDGTVLTISGNGKMGDYSYNPSLPWGTSITKVIIEDGVTSVGNSAFDRCTGLNSVTIPDSVTSIGDGAFFYCTGLSSIIIPNSVTSIGYGAFGSCTGLTSVTIGNSVTSIGDWAFDGCTGLTEVYITDLAAWCKINFAYGPVNPLVYAKMLYIDGVAATDITIPDSVTSIGDGAFMGYAGLTSIIISDSVTSIGDYAFEGCTSLTSITIPDSVTEIGWSAFYGCSNLNDVYYLGSRSDRNNIDIYDNYEYEPLSSATWHYDECVEAEEHSYTLNGGNVCSVCNKCKRPTLAAKTDTTVTLTQVEGLEYSMDGTTWQSGNVFTGLLPITTYTFYQRLKNTDKSSYSFSVTTLKATVSAPAAPTLASKTDTSVTLTAVSGMEYSKDGTTWQSSNVFTGLSPNTTYTFYQRVAETATCNVSAKSNGTAVKTNKVSVDAPAAPTLSSKTDTAVTLTVVNGMEYSKDGTTWQANNVFTGLDPKTTYIFYQRVAETDTYSASEKSAGLSVTTNRGKHATPSAPTFVSSTTSQVTLLAIDGMEYSKNGTTWQKSNVFSGLALGEEYTFYQRVAETDSYYASESSPPLRVVVKKSECSIIPVKPIIADYTSNSVTLYNIPGYEYSKNGTTWQSSNVFSGLSTETKYTFYQRVKETEIEEASTATSVSITTPRIGLDSNATFDVLAYYIRLNANTTMSGNPAIIETIDYDSETTISVIIIYKGSNIQFCVLNSGKTSTKLDSMTYFELEKSNKNTFVAHTMSYYYRGVEVDSVTKIGSIDRSKHTKEKQYAFYESGDYITSTQFCDIFNANLKFLCTYADVFLGESVSAGLKAFGFTSYDGLDTPLCDPATSYHTGGTEKRGARAAGCVIDGNTGHTYCKTCQQKLSSGTVIESVGHHTYSAECDADCDKCSEERKVEHTYSADCDKSCNVCSSIRTVSSEHVFDDENDKECNRCGEPAYTPGDLTGDDKINSLDGLMLMRYLNGWENLNIASPEAMDVNADGKVNSLDGLLLMRYLNGWNVQLG